MKAFGERPRTTPQQQQQQQKRESRYSLKERHTDSNDPSETKQNTETEGLKEKDRGKENQYCEGAIVLKQQPKRQ